MKKLFFHFAFLPEIKKFLKTLHRIWKQICLYTSKQLVPLLFPRHCPLCGKLVPYGDFIHQECRKELPLIHSPVCLRCGKPVSSYTQEYCYDCRIFPKSFKQGTALFLYNNKTRPFMSSFKYQNNRMLADFFSQELIEHRLSLLEQFGIDAVVPIPIHKNKYKKRGYNQAALLSSRLALALNLSHYPDILIRSVDTLPQKQFSPQARLNNLQKAFCFNPRYDKLLSQNTSLSILLVDDIYTSGATMEACTRILLESGVSEVYILSICIGIARD